MSIAKVILLIGLSMSGMAQQLQQVVVNPDCIIPFAFTATGQVAPANANSAFNNKQVGCNVWQIQYANTGFATVTITLQSAPDSSGVPGAWGTMGGTLIFGINPNTNTSGASSLINTFGTTFAPWVRVLLAATGSGQVTGVAFGIRQAGSGGATGGGGSSNVTVVAPLGQQAAAASVSVAIANNQAAGTSSVPIQGAAASGSALAGNPVLQALSDGTNAQSALTCDRAKPIITNLSGSGNTQIFAGTVAQNIYVCDIEFSTGTPEDFKYTEGTGANCGTGTADATALMKNISAWSLTPAGGYGSLITQTTGDSLCANQANAQAAGVTVWAIKF